MKAPSCWCILAFRAASVLLMMLPGSILDCLMLDLNQEAGLQLMEKSKKSISYLRSGYWRIWFIIVFNFFGGNLIIY